MFSRRILELGVMKPKLLVHLLLFNHTDTCPTKRKQPVCPGAGGLIKGNRKPPCSPGGNASPPSAKGGTAGSPCSFGGDADPPSSPPSTGPSKLVRAEKSGQCRMVIFPEGWFLFFRPITGVTGPYFLMLGIANYLVSKEILVMEHEYYTGLSQFIMLWYATTRIGPNIAAWLDSEVDSIVNYYEKERKDQIAVFEKIKKEAELAKWRAEGQKLLIDAKKVNILMQLEAFYRERLASVYQNVTGRMNYHIKRQRTENRIHQKWMLQWILENVRNSITPDFKKQAMESAIKDLATLATRAK